MNPSEEDLEFRDEILEGLTVEALMKGARRRGVRAATEADIRTARAEVFRSIGYEEPLKQ